MALTIPIYLGVRFGIIALRQNFLAPLQDAWNMVGANPHARDWVLNQFFTNSAGRISFRSSMGQPMCCCSSKSFM